MLTLAIPGDNDSQNFDEQFLVARAVAVPLHFDVAEIEQLTRIIEQKCEDAARRWPTALENIRARQTIAWLAHLERRFGIVHETPPT
jgi:hypothetical protein